MRLSQLVRWCGMISALAPMLVPLAADGAERNDDLGARLARLVERLDAQREAEHVPGMALVVAVGDEVVLEHGFGVADVATGRPVTPDTVFAIGSASKAFTATLIAMAVEDGRMSWDDPVVGALPWFRLPVEGGSPRDVTIRDLLAHRTGFARMGVLWARGRVPPRRVLRVATEAEPVGRFRAGFHYNNVMYLAAGAAYERTVGQSWHDAVERRLFAPLGMTRASTNLAAAREGGALASGYAWDEALGRVERRPMRRLDAIAPAGAINASARDMGRWLLFLLGEGRIDGERLIAPDVLRETWTAQIALGPGVDYGLGWMLREWNSRRVVEHGGNIDGFASTVAFLPDERIGFALLTNTSGSALQQAALPIVWETLLGDPPAPDPRDAPARDGEAKDLDRYAGEYLADFGVLRDTRLTVTVREGRLALDVPGQMVYLLRPPGADGRRAFELTDAIAVSFEEDRAGRVVGMRLHQGGFDFDLPRAGVEIEPPVPAAELADYLGRYRNGGEGREVEFALYHGRPALVVAEQGTFTLDPPDAAGRWALRARAGVSIGFERDPSGAVVRLVRYEGEEPVESAERIGPVPNAAAVAPAPPSIAAIRRGRAGGASVWDDLERIGAIRIDGRVRYPNAGIGGRFRGWLAPGTRERVEIDLGPFGEIVTELSGRRGEIRSDIVPSRVLRGRAWREAVASSLSLLVSDWSRAFAGADVRGETTYGDRPAWRVRIDLGGEPPLDAVVDAETGDVLETRTSIGVLGGAAELPVTTTYSGHTVWSTPRGSLRLPRRIVVENDAIGRTVIELVRLRARNRAPDLLPPR